MKLLSLFPFLKMNMIPFLNLVAKLNPKTSHMAFLGFTYSELSINNGYIELISNHKWRKKYEKASHYQIVLHLLNSFRCDFLLCCLCLLLICKEEFDCTRGCNNTIVFAFPSAILIGQTYPCYIPCKCVFHLLVLASFFALPWLCSKDQHFF
jgi:hypothetical protein